MKKRLLKYSILLCSMCLVLSANASNLLVTFSDTTFVEACGSYALPSGNQAVTTSGFYNDTIPDSFGGDSILCIEVVINEIYNVNVDDDLCFGEFYDFGGIDIGEPGTYTSLFQSIHGCDSLVSLELDLVTLDNTVEIDGNSMEAIQGFANFQWIDCNDNNEPIDGATEDTFEVTETGSYAVEITQNSCTVVSDCFDFEIISVGETDLDKLKLYPNPVMDFLWVDGLSGFTGTTSVIDLSGREVMRVNAPMIKKIDMSDLHKGVYFLRLVSQSMEVRTFSFTKL